MIPLLQTKTADTAHTEIFASVTRPLSLFFGWGLGTRLEYMSSIFVILKFKRAHLKFSRKQANKQTSKQASKQANIHTHVCNAAPLVWGSLRLAPINHLLSPHTTFNLTSKEKKWYFGIFTLHVHTRRARNQFCPSVSQFVSQSGEKL